MSHHNRHQEVNNLFFHGASTYGYRGSLDVCFWVFLDLILEYNLSYIYMTSGELQLFPIKHSLVLLRIMTLLYLV